MDPVTKRRWIAGSTIGSLPTPGPRMRGSQGSKPGNAFHGNRAHPGLRPVNAASLPSVLSAGFIDSESAGPLIVSARMVGHNDHCSREFVRFAASLEEEYPLCVCWGGFHVAAEGLWQYTVPSDHADVSVALRDVNAQVVVEQRIAIEYELTRRWSGTREYEYFDRAEILPIGRSGAAEPDPHWFFRPFPEYCGMIVRETIQARAHIMERWSPTATFPAVWLTETRESGVRRVPGHPGEDAMSGGTRGMFPPGFRSGFRTVDNPWTTRTASYTPYHCLDGAFTPGSNVGPRIPGGGEGVTTPPGSGGGTPTPPMGPSRPGGPGGTSHRPGAFRPYDPQPDGERPDPGTRGP